MLKRTAAFILAMAIFLLCSFLCFAIEYDGIPHNDEWQGSAVYSFENPEGFNNDVSFAYMRVIPRAESNQLYLCVSMRVDDISSPENSAVILSLNYGEDIYLAGAGNSPYNQNLYNVEYAMACDVGAQNITYEIMLGVKHGVPDASVLTVRLCDCNGVPSNEFGFELDVINELSEPETTKITESDEEKPSGTKADKTKKPSKTKSQKSSSKNKNGNDFTFKKVENSGQAQLQHDSAGVENNTSAANLTQQINDNSVYKKKLLSVVGVLCAVSVAGCAVYGGIRKSNKK